MQRRKHSFPIFAGYLILSLILLFLSQIGWLNDVTDILQSITLPVQQYSFTFFQQNDGREISKLKNENRVLLTRLTKVKELEKDNQALRDQFAIVNPAPKKLIPAAIVGFRNFLPGIKTVDSIIIDKGSKDKINLGNSVVFKDNLIGKVVSTSPRMSIVNLLNHKDVSFTAQTAGTDAIGIITGTGEGKRLVFDRVLSVDRLRIGDVVVTKDPQLLVVGKIVSVNAKASDLFQAAIVESLEDVAKLKIVFVLLQQDD